MRQWILFLIAESNYDNEVISDVYTRIVDFYSKYDNLKFIAFNLNKTHELHFY
jgi:hypothetical protein